MRLEKIKLAGFKSFVDPTTIQLRSHLAGIVGPNGCGKSNVIDAVRWVLGESSVKTLRGESMDDVIFSGSSARKPAGQASVELLFDNSDGSLGGEYANYSQIAIRREVTRDAQSSYYLNGTRCRRRDIKDIFAGTGLGPRGHAIIQQGTISRIIEAKPDEMRNLVEEAAGISRYKDRRRETENRMRHTRENLERVNDIRDELDKQLDRLKRQSRAAERYKELKVEQRQLQAQLYALKLQAINEKLQSQKGTLQQKEVALEAQVAQLRRCDSDIETQREKQTELTDEFNEIQKKYYTVGAEIVRLEQALQHGRQRCDELTRDLQQVQVDLAAAKQNSDLDQQKIESLTVTITELTPQVNTAKQTANAALARLTDAETTMQQWQQTWDTFNVEAAQASEQAQVERARIQQLEQRISEATTRLESIKTEQQQLDDSQLRADIAELTATLTQQQQQLTDTQTELTQTDHAIQTQRQANQTDRNQLDQLRSQLQKAQGRFASLEALQQAALGQQSDQLVNWLQQHELADYPRLAQQLAVETGWERAVETVLGDSLQAVCVNGIDSVNAVLGDLNPLPAGQMMLLATTVDVNTTTDKFPTLRTKISAPNQLANLVDGIYAADTLAQALAWRDQLTANESIVTPEGIWISQHWLRIANVDQTHSGVIERKQELAQLQDMITQTEADISQCDNQLTQGEQQLQTLEQQRNQRQQQLDQHRDQLNHSQTQLTVKQARCEQLAQRCERLHAESQQLLTNCDDNRKALEQSRTIWQAALATMETQADTRDQLQQQRDQLRTQLESVRPQAHSAKDAFHQVNMQLNAAQSESSLLTVARERLQKQMNDLTAREAELQQNLHTANAPLTELDSTLQATLTQRSNVEEIMQQARVRLSEAEQQLRDSEHARSDIDDSINGIRDELEKMRLDAQGDSVRRANLAEQLAETGQALQDVLSTVTVDNTVDSIDRDLSHVGDRIQRLGAINLAAIEEYDVELERKQHLDSQYADLSDALAILEAAIRKIDRETKQRFKGTFDQINANFQELFPSLFTGGQASLELVGEDLLEAGVTVMARPPGKRNSSIHLLSGGEKALTAIALVFAIFKLNPAPFCMLDEVDAPLDDANVLRFCNLVQKIAETVQVIFISHNKVAIEISKQLMGVTMHEPGVSRLVAVDVDEAVAMAQDEEVAA